MSLARVKFNDKVIETYTVDVNGEKWMMANPFAEALNYSNVNRAIRVHVNQNNQRDLEQLQSDQIGLITSSLHPRTKFINRAGVFELIHASDMPAAKRFKSWNTNELLPTLCQEGEYNMVADAPVDIAHGMNAIHAATNEGIEAPWTKDLDHLKSTIVEKDRKIDELTVALTQSNEKLMYLATSLVESNAGLIKANEKIQNLANRIADLAQDVIAKPSNPRLLHALAVCSVGGDQYVFLRPQKRSLSRSLNRLAVGEKDIVFKSDYVPNAMNVLNKVKEYLPKDKYQARHNRITLHDDLTREDLVKAIRSTLMQRQMVGVANTKRGRES